MTYKDPVGAHRHAGLPFQEQEWADLEVVGEDVAGVMFQDCRFSNVQFRNLDLSQVNMMECVIDNCLFEDCVFRRTVLGRCRGFGFRVTGGSVDGLILASCDFEQISLGQSMQKSVFAESRIQRVSLDGAGVEQYLLTISGTELGEFHLENARWNQCSAVEVDFSNWTCTNAHFDTCNFVKVRAVGVDLRSVRFERCNMYGSVLDGARLRHAEGSIFAECQMRETELQSGELAGALFAKVQAEGARFDQAELDGAMFPKANLASAQFPGVRARTSVWAGANLEGANFDGADLYQSTFRNAVLADASVQGASFRECDLHGVEESLHGADLSGARETIAWRLENEKAARAEREGAASDDGDGGESAD